MFFLPGARPLGWLRIERRARKLNLVFRSSDLEFGAALPPYPSPKGKVEALTLNLSLAKTHETYNPRLSSTRRRGSSLITIPKEYLLKSLNRLTLAGPWANLCLS
jgi:hypothetical protein